MFPIPVMQEVLVSQAPVLSEIRKVLLRSEFLDRPLEFCKRYGVCSPTVNRQEVVLKVSSPTGTVYQNLGNVANWYSC